MPVIGLIALTAAALFSGAAIYINLAEQPARLGLDDRSMLAEWKPAYARGLPMQVSLAMIAALSGLLEWWRAGDGLWLVGAILMLANLPYTLVAIMPVNRLLDETSDADATSTTRHLITRWGRLHAGRSLLGAVATILFLLAAARLG